MYGAIFLHRHVALGLLLAAASAALALWAGQRPPSLGGRESVTLVAGRAGSLQQAIFSHGAQRIVLRAEAGSALPWRVDVVADEKSPTQSYPASELAMQLTKQLLPFQGTRLLGTLSDEQRQRFGLLASEQAPQAPAQLQLRAAGKEAVLTLGHALYGGGDYYVSSADGQVGLASSELLAPFVQGGAALRETRLVALPRPAFDSVTVRYQGQTRAFLQRHGDEPERLFVADPAAPEVALPLPGTWLSRLLQITLTEMVALQPPGEALLTVSFAAQQTEVGVLQLWPEPRGGLALAPGFSQPVLISGRSFASLCDDLAAVLAAAP